MPGSQQPSEPPRRPISHQVEIRTKEGEPRDCSRREFLRLSLIAGTMLATSQVFGEQSELAGLSLQKVSELVRKKSVSPVELTQECLKRIERLNPVLNAFITVDAEGSLKQAREAEAELQHSKWRGPLHGIPVALKDNIDTAGIRTTAASAVFADRIPAQDAEVVRRLRAAGSVILGKLNMHEFAFGGTSITSHFGPVHNPWKLDHISGGSSGGPAVAVASGLCYGALGTDTAGSVRIPGAFCGVVGFKPTYGLVSNRGVIPLRLSLDHVGPLTRTVTDSALLLQPLAGYDPEDITSVDVPVPNYAEGLGVSKLSSRLGVPRVLFYDKLDPDIEKAVQQALAVLSRFARSTQDVELPEVTNLPVAPTGAEVYAYHAQYMARSPQLYQQETLLRLRTTAEVSAATYIDAVHSIQRLRREVKKVFAAVDLLVTPTMAIPPASFPEAEQVELEMIQKRQLSPLTRNTVPFDVYGLPTITVPCGFTHDGLPIGLQISGPPWGEAQVLRLARAYEQATDWNRRPPTW
jgi:aspartyl-tRNA(Asn)/glutamyl-tRNA(Gln) amidotransferase subunit A